MYVIYFKSCHHDEVEAGFGDKIKVLALGKRLKYNNSTKAHQTTWGSNKLKLINIKSWNMSTASIQQRAAEIVKKLYTKMKCYCPQLIITNNDQVVYGRPAHEYVMMKNL